jgi:biopolymer transport protein ExbB/TolQ
LTWCEPLKKYKEYSDMNEIVALLTPFIIFVEKAVLALLVGLEFAVIAIFIWRWRTSGKAKGYPEKWIKALTADISIPHHPPLVLSESESATISGRVVKTGLANIGLAPEALEKLFDVQESAEKRELDRGLAFLATVGSNAPFLGLTGTVIGILVAFNHFAASGGKGSTEVMTAISQSLVATAAGLIVAIPAVVFYNLLRNRTKGIMEEARELRGLIVARSLNIAFSRVEA